MTVDVVFVDAGTHLNVLCGGVWDPIEVTEIARRIRAKADELRRDKVFVDWCMVSMPSDQSYRVYSGEDIATILSPPLKIAVLYRRALINKVAEDIAVGRGATVLVHHDQAHLLRWLLDAPAV